MNNPNTVKKLTKPVVKYDKHGNILNRYNSISEAAMDNNIKSKSDIANVCKSKFFSAGGFLWAWEGDEKTIKRKLELLKQKGNNIKRSKLK
jgi:hypothetical protein